eukprot:9768388-Alexandrium_andersonii.AAC.1
MSASLVGSEMCIRDRVEPVSPQAVLVDPVEIAAPPDNALDCEAEVTHFSWPPSGHVEKEEVEEA